MKVSIVIPNWNGVEKLRRNLPRVMQVVGVDEIIVSDDASTDTSVEVLKKEFPQVKVLTREKNGGFSSNVNHGVSAATGDLIFLLNSDAVPAPDCLRFVLPHFENLQVFSVGCSTGGNWSWAKFEKGYVWHYMSPLASNEPHETLWASGGGGVFRMSGWEALGGMDELFDPFYEEDTDLGYRAWKRGFINIFEPKAHVEHYKEKGVIELNFSKETVTKTAQRNQLFLIWKNIHDGTMIRSHIFNLIKMLITHPKYWEVFLKAMVKLPDVLQKRATEKKFARVRDGDILKRY